MILFKIYNPIKINRIDNKMNQIELQILIYRISTILKMKLKNLNGNMMKKMNNFNFIKANPKEKLIN